MRCLNCDMLIPYHRLGCPFIEKIVLNETVNHPSHYGGDTVYEHHKVVRAWGLGYALGNATKYICRGGKKTSDAVEDLKKAIWYIQSEIDHLESKK